MILGYFVFVAVCQNGKFTFDQANYQNCTNKIMVEFFSINFFVLLKNLSNVSIHQAFQCPLLNGLMLRGPQIVFCTGKILTSDFDICLKKQSVVPSFCSRLSISISFPINRFGPLFHV